MRIGIAGSGFMGGVHTAAIQRLANATLIAVASRTQPTADGPTSGNLQHVKSSGLPPNVKWYADWREMLLDPELDAVDICLPTHLHKEVALRAFELGKHVLCEKPMALNSADCEAMMNAASRSGRVFMIAHVLRFAFPYNYAATFIDKVCGGQLKGCTLSRKSGYPQWSDWVSREECSGGAIMDLFIHDIDQALLLFGMPASVSAVSMGQIDTMQATLQYANGLDVQIEGGWLAPEIPFSAGFKITGNNATLTLENGKLFRNHSTEEESIEMPEQDEYLDEISYFVECCRNHSTPERCRPVESAEAVRVANYLKTSRTDNGRIIHL